MKKTILYFFLLVTLISVSGCRKDVVVVETTGSLVVNARDSAGASLIGSTVYLYNNQADFNNSLFSQTRITDNSGQVVFYDLRPGFYYVDTDFTNTAGQVIVITGSGSVTAGYETTVTMRP